MPSHKPLFFFLFLIFLFVPRFVFAADCSTVGTCIDSADFSNTCLPPDYTGSSDVCPKDQQCCVPVTTAGGPPTSGGPTPPGGPPTPGGPKLGPELPITFSNTLNYCSVNGVLGSILTWLQGIIATLALIFIVIGGFLYITSGGDAGRAETAKKCITAAVIGFALAIAAPSFLRAISDILGWSAGPMGVSGCSDAATIPVVGTQLTIAQILANVLKFLLSVVGVIAIIMLVIGGLMYILASGDEDQIDRAKKLVKYAVIGIFIALAALILVTQIAKFFL